ncbi:hypothetical protein DCAR_0729529 [Daucus carota subsp. sativus]|uniref:Uncharacterized protein n=1 Tax=Daucus carota subsp. sativus TaxID=79200 RepID=A0AAF0XL47_DAUCS|nr:PREDICTED: uncharacterized protein LOC108195264 [Daucus carota subsp. sativus]XP_017217708.1 PREDICTED: uncharacterized protein LOC108195264 [Daucus carota subsp. sativus]XP_017217709.1 PREDICTED: uncharacterized protein LOC108195264 [Daucus carota subsp. sativus]XP_017217710.1 PREDICTED: uncharacterized protein LOC108195264 [Daucus carota subsp. sativus]WOH10068.1 hypothetical protein DCAR_0729529 [Daucus carota subsp. sativus]
MAMVDSIETHPAKKMKLQDKEIPKSQYGINTVNFENSQPTMEYSVYMEIKVVKQLFSSPEDPLCFFSRMMKDIGCAESQISKYGCSSFHFLAQLTPDKAKKLSELDSVREVKPHKKSAPCFPPKLYVLERCPLYPETSE